MRLLRPLPPGRTYEQVENHYLVEKALAERLRNAPPEERPEIYSTMYEELFRLVPDHPRLTQRHSEELTRSANASKLALIGPFLTPDCVFLEFAPGDCRFALDVARSAGTVYGVDISAQAAEDCAFPENFILVIYDGYHLDEVPDDSVDLAFSDQLIEHLHPENTWSHLELVRSKLKSGGKYVFRTPHAFTGPHDVSQFFSDEPQGFHLKEWTLTEIGDVLADLGFSRHHALWEARGMRITMPRAYARACERGLDALPRRGRRALAKYLVPSVCVIATK